MLAIARIRRLCVPVRSAGQSPALPLPERLSQSTNLKFQFRSCNVNSEMERCSVAGSEMPETDRPTPSCYVGPSGFDGT